MTNSKFLENLIAGSSAKMQEVRQHIALAAPYPVNVLAIGPTGSGKELIAKGIHKLSARSGKFIAVNTAAIPADLLEAELFGHEKDLSPVLIKREKERSKKPQTAPYSWTKLETCLFRCRQNFYAS